MMATDHKAVIVGISGCSSSGKTTLARFLRAMFPHSFVLHEDDFYKAEDQLPLREGLVDWDCPEAVSVPDLERALAHIRATGTFPPFLDSKEDQNSVGASPVTDDQVAAVRARVEAWLQPGQPGSLIFSSPSHVSSSCPPNTTTTNTTTTTTTTSSSSSFSPAKPTPPPPPPPPPIRLCLLDGFLLYAPPVFSGVMAALDVKLFLRASRRRATQRREARAGYVTLEGFWQDPPGYFDKVVWPNYAAAHAWMFERGDAERGALDGAALARAGVLALTGEGVGAGADEVADDDADVDFARTLAWAADTIMRELERVVLGSGEGRGKV